MGWRLYRGSAHAEATTREVMEGFLGICYNHFCRAVGGAERK